MGIDVERTEGDAGVVGEPVLEVGARDDIEDVTRRAVDVDVIVHELEGVGPRRVETKALTLSA